MLNPIQKAYKLGHSIWIDDIRRGMLESGELKQLINQGICGLTSNPSVLEKAILDSSDYDEGLSSLAQPGKSALEIYEAIVIEGVRYAADLLRPIYEETNGVDGYVYLQLSPFLAYDTEAQIEECQRLWATLHRPNCGIKIPATREGIIAIRRLINKGINVTATLVFSLDAYSDIREAYFTGLEDLIRTGGGPGRVSSLVAFPLSRIDTLVDGLLQERIRQGETKLESLMGKAAIATARLAYQDFKEAFRSPHFASLRANGARVQRLLWASTRAKNPRYRDLMYVEPLIGKDSVNTMSAITIKAFLEHGHTEASLEKDVADAHQTMAALAEAGINMKQVTAKLLDGGIQTFVDSFSRLLAGIDRKIKS